MSFSLSVWIVIRREIIQNKKRWTVHIFISTQKNTISFHHPISWGHCGRGKNLLETPAPTEVLGLFTADTAVEPQMWKISMWQGWPCQSSMEADIFEGWNLNHMKSCEWRSMCCFFVRWNYLLVWMFHGKSNGSVLLNLRFRRKKNPMDSAFGSQTFSFSAMSPKKIDPPPQIWPKNVEASFEKKNINWSITRLRIIRAECWSLADPKNPTWDPNCRITGSCHMLHRAKGVITP